MINKKLNILLILLFVFSISVIVIATHGEDTPTLNIVSNWDFSLTQNDSNVFTKISVINDTVLEITVDAIGTLPPGNYRWRMALCNISNLDSIKHQFEDAQGGFENSFAQLTNFDTLTNFGMDASWCGSTNGEGFVLFSSGAKNDLPAHFRIILPEGNKKFELFTGDGTEIVVGQTVNKLSYELSWANVNISLAANLSGDWNSTVNDIWIRSGNKFGADYKTEEESLKFRYLVESSREIKNNGLNYYISRTTNSFCGSTRCLNEEQHNFDFTDICRVGIESYEYNISIDDYYKDENENPVFNGTRLEPRIGHTILDPKCSFTQEGNNLEVIFSAFRNESTGNITIDPTITITDVSSAVSILTNITTENNFTHLKIRDSGAPINSSNLVFYNPFDVNTSLTTYDYSDNNNDGTLTGNINWSSTQGLFGGAYGFSGNESIDIGNGASLNVGEELVASGWFRFNNPQDSVIINGDFEDDFTGWDFSGSGAGSNTTVTAEARFGSFSARLNASIGAHHKISQEVTLEEDGMMSWYWNVSSEECCDYFLLCIDDKIECLLGQSGRMNLDSRFARRISGSVGWAFENITLTKGTHNITFSYDVDTSVSQGDNSGHVDNITISYTQGTILSKGTLGDLEQYTLRIFGNKLQALVGENRTVITGNTNLTTGNWYHATLVYDGNSANDTKLYLNGVLEAQGNTTQSSLKNGGESAVIGGTKRSPIKNGDFELGDMTDWMMGGKKGLSRGWEKVSGGITGTFAATSGTPLSSLEANIWMEQVVELDAPGTLTFYWNVSSEANFDFLTFTVDDPNSLRLSGFDFRITGEVPWTNVSIALTAGNHSLSWKYMKDQSTSIGADSGYVDNITITGANVTRIYFNGIIDDVMILNTSISDSQVLDLFNNQSSRFFTRGEQEFQDNNVTNGTFVNITINSSTNFNSIINVTVGDVSGNSYNFGDEFAFTNNFVSDIPITTPNNISIKFIFYAGNNTNPFISPNLENNIIIESFGEAVPGGDSFGANITQSISPTLINGKIQGRTRENTLFFTINFIIKRLYSGFRDLIQSFSITSIIDTLKAQFTSISETFSITSLIDKIKGQITSVTQPFTETSIIQRIYSAFRTLTQPFSITSLVNTLKGQFTSISQSFTITSLVETIKTAGTGATAFTRAVVQSLTFNLSIDRIYSAIRDLIQSFSITSLIESLKGQFTSVTQTFSITSIVETIKGQVTSINQNFQITSIIQRTYNAIRSIIQPFQISTVLNTIQGRFTSLIQTFSITSLVNTTFAAGFDEFIRNISQSFNLTSIIEKLSTFSRTIFQSILLFFNFSRDEDITVISDNGLFPLTISNEDLNSICSLSVGLLKENTINGQLVLDSTTINEHNKFLLEEHNILMSNIDLGNILTVCPQLSRDKIPNIIPFILVFLLAGLILMSVNYRNKKMDLTVLKRVNSFKK